MKTNPLQKPLIVEPPYSVAEEAFFKLSGAPAEQRVLLATALFLAAQALIGDVSFEINTISHERLAFFNGDSKILTASPEVTAAIQNLEPFVRAHARYVQQATVEVLHEELMAQQTSQSEMPTDTAAPLPTE